MKLTKQLENEVLKVIDSYWNNYIKGNIRAMIPLLDENYTQVGSAESEVFDNKKDAVKFLYDTIKEVAGKLEMRNRVTKVETLDDFILIHDKCDLYALNKKKWIFYAKFRASSLLKKKKGGWKIIHQHSSFPDTKTEEGGNLTIENIAAENQQLRDAVKRRTVELEQKNRELEIETSLEKVRAVAMGMKKPEDMLTICKTISIELAKLGVKEIRNVQTAIFYESRGTYMNYEYYAKHDKTIITETTYTNNRIHKAFAIKMLKGRGQNFFTYIKGKKVKEWLAYQKTTNVFIDKYLNTASSLNYYWHSLGPVALGISTYVPLKKEELELFQRFLKVFELAYRRYLDIEKANAQAREAQIEVSLERIRAAAMAMRDSAELSSIIYKLYGELTKLDAKLDRCFIMIVNPDNKGITWWLAGKEGLLAENGFFIQLNQHPSHLMYLDNWKKRKKKWQYLFEGKEKKDWDRFGFSKTELNRLPGFIKKDMAGVRKVNLSGSSDQFGSLVTGSFEPLPEEQQDIISRFTIAFNQAYIRFLDLQKAEAQARESQIELGLERVRARAMAMQHSDELAELVATVFRELNQLDFSLASCIIWIHSPADKSNALWIASDEMNKPARPLQIVPFYPPFFASIIIAWKAKDPKWIFSLTGTEKNKFQKLFFKQYPELPDALRKPVSENKQITFSASFNNFGALEIVATEPLTDEKFDILHRFGKVFNSSYTRFNDLKKAEAQAREAQIELAVERVRAKALAMHKSEEILDVVKTMRNELGALNIPGVAAATIYLQQENGDVRLWDITSMKESEEGIHFSMNFNFRMEETDPGLWIRKIWDAAENYVVIEQDEHDLRRAIEWTRSHNSETAEMTQQFIKTNKIVGSWHPVVKLSNGKLATDFIQPPPAEVEFILTKMGASFDLAYTRFLDLQKAEAQARESQIEAALERIRSVSMAIRKSNELFNIIHTVFGEWKKLGLEIFECNINLLDRTKKEWTNWGTGIGEAALPRSFLFPWFDDPFVNQLYEDSCTGVSYRTYNIEGKKLRKFLDGMFTKTDFKNAPEEYRRELYSIPKIHLTHAFMQYGSMDIVGPDSPPESIIEILKRFAKVFEQAYTRYLDVVKAETQAREAQIEVAVERVRAKALAMHKSEDLHSVVVALKKELMGLQIPGVTASTIYLEQEDGSIRILDISDTGEKEDDPSHFKMDKVIRLEDTDPDLWIRRIWNGTENYFVVEVDEADFKRVVAWLYTLDKEEAQIAEKIIQEKSIKKAWLPTVKLEKGRMNIDLLEPPTPEIESILLKMGAGFDLAYKRFLDLQKAEAQAREAQIEAALERVRSRTMAMHKSDELLEASEILFSEMQKLGIESLTAGYVLMDKEEKNGLNYTPDPSTKKILPLPVIIPHNETKHMRQVVENWKKGSSFYVVEMDEEETIKHQTFIAERSTNFTLNAEQLIAISPPRLFLHNFYFKEGYLLIVGGNKLSAEQTDIMLRFTKVFQQTYTRFLDLQKAEAQAREAQIEAALERVRSRSMAMHKSEELADLSLELVKQVQALGVATWFCAFNIYDDDPKGSLEWGSNGEGTFPRYRTPRERVFLRYYEAGQRGEILLINEIGESECPAHYDYLCTLSGVGEQLLKMKAAGIPFPASQIDHVAYFKYGYIIFITYKSVPESHDIFIRFAKVFEQTYTRFLDLQKAEAQAREAQIQLALERVRARTMAMHKSDELPETSHLLFEQMKELGEPVEQLTIGIVNEENNAIEISATLLGDTLKKIYSHSIEEPYMMAKVYKAWKKQQKTLVVELRGDELNAYNQYRNELTNSKMFPTNLGKEHQRIVYAAFFSKGMLALGANETRPPESLQLLEKFASVFDLTYTRFLDLQKAEAQAREAQIETALERVRSRSMGMQKSDELKEVIKLVYQQLIHLKINLDHAGFVVDYKPKGDWTFWIADEQDIPSKITHPYFESVWANQFNEAKEKGADFFVTNLNFEEKNKFYQELLSYVPGLPEASKEFYLSCPALAATTVLFNNIGLYIENFSGTPYTDDENKILLRFGKVFEQTYTRFNDLQKAEAQAREAQIEAALERVRSRSMGMQKSEELREVIQVIYEQLIQLNFKIDSAGFFVDPKQSNDYNSWSAEANAVLPTMTHVPYFDHPINNDYIKHRDNGPELFAKSYPFEEKNKWWLELFKRINGVPEETKKVLIESRLSSPGLALSRVFMKNIGLYILNFSGTLYSEAENTTLIRFCKAFEQTYTRFNDLKQAEVQAREAQIEAALERVRSRTMGMQKSEELAETAAIVFKQLIGLGVEPNRLYIGLIKDDSGDIEAWTTDEDGSRVNKMFVLNRKKNTSVQKMFTGWKESKKSLIIDMQGTELSDYIHYLSEELHAPFIVGLTQHRRVQTIAYFSKGFIGIASPEPQPDETLNLLERFAAVFNLTYTRFNDLKIAEAHAIQAEEDLQKLHAEKKRTEVALAELQATQKQLIQSEKMASLGELTAGIAHEIQNPLNFVNNFSEVSKELLDEMKEAIEKGNSEEAKEIMNNVIQNLEKINHHGKRADGIVKGMLQHSRAGSGQKEPTDINNLCDEYLRLAFHGLRAKDKSFNAKFESEFDPSIGKINVMPQDMGRVILNLINNAFYAVSEKKRRDIDGYEPTVIVTTKKIEDKIEIKVQDNGSGIPQKVLDKIFQPFFTTKPTGQGTGLGLSLSYDIIKAHGGELKVETKEWDGSEFIIVLPVK